MSDNENKFKPVTIDTSDIIINNPVKEVIKIVLTGGPCSGKTTAIRKLREEIGENYAGYEIIYVPETATKVFEMGFKKDLQSTNEFICNMQYEIEKLIDEYVEQSDSKKIAVIYDRGVLDSQAFMSFSDWFKMCMNNNEDLLEEETVLKKYTAIIHLVTAAQGAEKFFTNETNEYRNESIEQAVFIDEYLRKLYSKNDCHVVIDNSLTFEAKIQRTINMIKECIEIEPRDYLV